MILNKVKNIFKKPKPKPGKAVFDTAVLYERGDRPVMEDFYVLLQLAPKKLYGGVYDGHGGTLAAEYACGMLCRKFLGLMNEGHGAEYAFLESYKEIDDEILDPLVGTTAVDFFLDNRTLHYAHAGDSRLMTVKDNSFLQLTFDHRVFDPKEAARVRATDAAIDGSYVVKGNYAIEPTRTLGDRYFKTAGIIADPVVGVYNLSWDDKWLVAATDGLFDYVTDDAVAEIVSSSATAQEACDKLKRDVLTKTLHNDNVTAVVVRLDFRD